MSLATQVSTLSTRIGTEFKTVYGRLNALIDDASITTTSVWSSSKVSGAIAQVKSDILGTATAAMDTFGEVQAAMANDETAAAALSTAVGNRLRLDVNGGYSGAQQQQGRDNLSVYSQAQVGDPTTDFVAVFNAALT